MANNRMWIRCKCCGEFVGIGKHLAGPWYVPNEHLNKTLDDFFSKHAWCENTDSPFYDEKYSHSNMFELTTEGTKADLFYDKKTGKEYCKGDMPDTEGWWY